MVIKAPTTLNLDKKIISPDNMGYNSKNFAALCIDADTTINAGQDGGIDTGTNGGYGINVMGGATLTINGGYYYGGGMAVQVGKGTLIINGGHFACEPCCSNPPIIMFLVTVLTLFMRMAPQNHHQGRTFVNSTRPTVPARITVIETLTAIQSFQFTHRH